MAPTIKNKIEKVRSTEKKEENKRKIPGFISKSTVKKNTGIPRIGGEGHDALNRCLTTFISVLTKEALFHAISNGHSTLKESHLVLANKGIRKPTSIC